MTTDPPTNLDDANRQAGEGWLIDWFDPPSESMHRIRQSVAAVNRRAQERLSRSSKASIAAGVGAVRVS